MIWLWLFNPLLSLLLSFNHVSSAGAVATNRTIDDTTGDSATGAKPIYLPTTPGVWADATCLGCAIKPDKAFAFQGTWTAATYNPGLKSISIELDFKGTAIYVFFILANSVAPGVTTETACNFTLDGVHAGLFDHTPSLSTALQYNALVFSNNNLQNADHKLLIETNDVDHNVFVNFDYAIYTFDDGTTPPSSSLPTSSSSATTLPSTSSTSSRTSSSIPSSTTSTATSVPGNNINSKSQTNVAAIAGGTVGGVLALAAFVFGLLFCLRGRERSKEKKTAFPSDGTMFAPSNHTNEPGPTVERYRYVPPSLIINQHNTRPVTHSDFLQSGTILPTASTSLGGSLEYGSSTGDPYRGIVDSYANNHQSMHTPLPSGDVMLATTAQPLRPVRRPSEANSGTAEERRKARQLELEQQLRTVKAEMHALKRDTDRKSPLGPGRNPSEDQELRNMRDQMKIMSDQIQVLRKQQNSEWARGLSDEPPPGYTPAFFVRND